MSTPVRTKSSELVGLWLAIVILAAVAVLAYSSIDAAGETLGWVARAHRALQDVEEVTAAYSRAVTARRAYVVAGDSGSLADLPKLDGNLTQALDGARSSMSDNPAQLRRIDVMADLLRQRIVDLDSAVERRRVDGSAVETAKSVALAAQVRDVREEIEGEENRLLVERQARTRSGLLTTKIAMVVGTLASFAILLVAFRRLRLEVARRKRSEHALRAGEEFLSSIVENIPDMVFVKDARALRFERINRAGEELLGRKREELLGKSDFDFFPPEQARFFQANDRETLERRVVVDIAEEPIETTRGRRWLHTKKVPILDERGEPLYLLGISDDVTERREVAAALKAAKEAAEAAMQELEAFSYSVAHDLRAPLRSIDGFSRALEEDHSDQLDEAGADHVRRVRAAALHMNKLIEGLLGLAKLTRGEVAREQVNLTELVRQTGARLREAAPDRKVDLVVDEGLVASGDVRLLTSAIDNLVGNAWKFTSKSPSARIEVGRQVENGVPTYYVRDNGAGFEQAYAHRLFGVFQRLHAATDFEGSGIGLATVQRIVRRHGGRIWAKGEVGRGATFYFTL